MTLNISEVDPEFRQQCDLLLFSEKIKLDLKKFKSLLEKKLCHNDYLLDKFKRSTEIFWENGEELWFFRLSFLFDSVADNTLKEIESFLEKRMFGIIRSNKDVSPKWNVEFLQYLQFCKAKSQRNQSLSLFKNKLIELTPQISNKKIIAIVNHLIPHVFKDMNEFFEIISRRIVVSDTNFHLLLALEKTGITVDRAILAKLASELIIERPHSDRHARALLVILNDKETLQELKKTYTLLHHNKLLALVNECTHFYVLEENQFRNIKNLIALDPTLADKLAAIYVKKIINRTIHHKRANADRVIRLVNKVPEVNSKKILAFLSSNNQMADIRYITKAFPNLKKIAIFA